MLKIFIYISVLINKQFTILKIIIIFNFFIYFESIT